jgi:cobalamin-dependent methionine synthase I
VQPGDRHAPPPTPPTTLELVPGAIAGLALVVERQVRTMLDRAASATADTARIVTRPALVQRALSPIEDRLWQWNEIARREQARNRAEASALIPLIVQQVTENVVAQIDFVRVIEQVPMEEIVSHIDVEALVARIDLAGVIRESTSSLTGEAVDSLRDQGMALDALSARIVDRVLFRRKARKLGVTGR